MKFNLQNIYFALILFPSFLSEDQWRRDQTWDDFVRNMLVFVRISATISVTTRATCHWFNSSPLWMKVRTEQNRESKLINWWIINIFNFYCKCKQTISGIWSLVQTVSLNQLFWHIQIYLRKSGRQKHKMTNHIKNKIQKSDHLNMKVWTVWQQNTSGFVRTGREIHVY